MREKWILEHYHVSNSIARLKTCPVYTNYKSEKPSTDDFTRKKPDTEPSDHSQNQPFPGFLKGYQHTEMSSVFLVQKRKKEVQNYIET